VVPPPVPPLAVVPSSSPAPVQKPVIARPAPAPVQAAAPAAPAEEEKLQTLRELPEAIQRTVPPITFGGYMYSKNPADRLLLIDKTLRHEGEEVAPGLVLEKLLPKAAVMNYKGYRYRVPY
jgi:general secretion pathway protein B